MHKQIALAYGIAGLAVAFAVITVLGSGANLFAEEVTPEAQSAGAAEPSWAPAPAASERGIGAAAEMPVEYVYLDEPAASRRGHDDDYEDRDDDHDDDHDDGHDDYEENHDEEEREHRRERRGSDDD